MATVIDGSAVPIEGHVVNCRSGERPDTVIDGITVTGGNGVPSQFGSKGGGILADGSSPTVLRCVVVRNKGFTSILQGGPGGMSLVDSSSVVSDCWFVSNKASIAGGGIQVIGGSPQIVGCTFAANWAVEVGASIFAGGSDAIVLSCTFPKSSQYTVFCDGGTISIGDCTFCGLAASNGDAVWSLNKGGIVDLGGNVFIDECPNPCDIDIDGTVGGSDLGLMLALWGPTYPNGPGDIDGNSKVDGADLGLLLACWTG